MTQSTDIAIADIVVAKLHANTAQLPETLSGSVTIERRLMPVYTTGDLRTLKIAVAPRAQTRTLASRKHTDRNHIVQIAPHWFPEITNGQISDDDLEAFCDAMEAIADTIERIARAPGGFGGLTFLQLNTEPLYDADLAQSPGVLRGVLTVTFKRIASPPPI